MLRILLTEQERRTLESAADEKTLDVSTWARMVLLATATSKSTK